MSILISRRRVLQGVGAVAGLSAFAASLPLAVRRALAADFPATFKRKVVNILLEGGPDFRHMLVPKPDADPNSYGYSYWKYRASAQYLDGDKVDQWQARYSQEYLPVTQIAGKNVGEFGILKKAAWLHKQIVDGHVAIVSNVKHSENRDHSHSLLILQSGDAKTTSYQTDRDGWGGRIAGAVGGNVFSMTRQKHLFCNVPDAAGDKARVVSARNTRKFGLVRSNKDDWQEGGKAVTDRALSSYYTAKRAAPVAAPHDGFLHQEEVLRGFSTSVQGRLADVPIPDGIKALYDGDGRLLKRNANFGEQMRNLYDCFVCEQVVSSQGQAFNFRVGSLSYGGWDSHKNQRDTIEPQFEEIFGDARGLSSLFAALSNDMPAALDSTVFTIAGEFGRQLRSNGDRGTDHGRGNTVFVIGNRVKGGVYGEMFPAREIEKKKDGKSRYESYNEDIEGRTAFDHVFGSVADWVANDALTGSIVFPGRATAKIEAGLVLDRATLFSA